MAFVKSTESSEHKEILPRFKLSKKPFFGSGIFDLIPTFPEVQQRPMTRRQFFLGLAGAAIGVTLVPNKLEFLKSIGNKVGKGISNLFSFITEASIDVYWKNKELKILSVEKEIHKLSAEVHIPKIPEITSGEILDLTKEYFPTFSKELKIQNVLLRTVVQAGIYAGYYSFCLSKEFRASVIAKVKATDSSIDFTLTSGGTYDENTSKILTLQSAREMLSEFKRQSPIEKDLFVHLVIAGQSMEVTKATSGDAEEIVRTQFGDVTVREEQRLFANAYVVSPLACTELVAFAIKRKLYMDKKPDFKLDISISEQVEVRKIKDQAYRLLQEITLGIHDMEVSIIAKAMKLAGNVDELFPKPIVDAYKKFIPEVDSYEKKRIEFNKAFLVIRDQVGSLIENAPAQEMKSRLETLFGVEGKIEEGGFFIVESADTGFFSHTINRLDELKKYIPESKIPEKLRNIEGLVRMKDLVASLLFHPNFDELLISLNESETNKTAINKFLETKSVFFRDAIKYRMKCSEFEKAYEAYETSREVLINSFPQIPKYLYVRAGKIVKEEIGEGINGELLVTTVASLLREIAPRSILSSPEFPTNAFYDLTYSELMVRGAIEVVKKSLEGRDVPKVIRYQVFVEAIIHGIDPFSTNYASNSSSIQKLFNASDEQEYFLAQVKHRMNNLFSQDSNSAATALGITMYDYLKGPMEIINRLNEESR